jgi:hypothetical protein
MQSAEALDPFVSGPEKQVIRISEDDLGAELVVQLTRRKRFHRSLGTHRHENGGLHRAMSGMEQACPGASFGAGPLYLEAKR